MSIRIAIAALLVAGVASPAWAVDYCKTSVSRDGRAALVDGLVDGATLQGVRVEDDPIAGTVHLGTKDYSIAGKGAATLTPYRTGQSVEGKDWRTPGSVATLFGGMALQWPRFYKGGNPVGETLIVFESGGRSQGVTVFTRQSDPDAMTLYVGWDALPVLPRLEGYRSQYISGTWSSAAVPGGELRVKFYDKDRSAPLGSVTFAWPDEAPWNARMVTQVNALRALSAAGKCTKAAILKGDPDEEDEEF